METITFQNDIRVLYVTASSFPKGIMNAHAELHKLVPYTTARKFFGISRPENGTIIYRAATEELKKGEAGNFHCDSLILEKGKYFCVTIDDYTKDVKSIESAFKEILDLPGIDPQGYCVEWYVTEKQVKCMVRQDQ